MRKVSQCQKVDGEMTWLASRKKSRIREIKHPSTDADSSTDTTVGLTKNTKKNDFFEEPKKSSKTQKLKNVLRYARFGGPAYQCERYSGGLAYERVQLVGNISLSCNWVILQNEIDQM